MFEIEELKEACDELRRVLADESGVVDAGIAGGVLIVRIRSSSIEHLIPESVYDIPVSICIIGELRHETEI